jgi:rhamnulokinase
MERDDMALAKRFLAFDLGAESGRSVVGVIENGVITLDVLHRFRTEGLVMLGTRQWDVARIYEELVQGLVLYARKYGPHLDGVGVDTWGVDFGLVASDGSLVGNPVHYRDRRNDGMMERAWELYGREKLYMETGIQYMQINTAFQVLSMVESKSPLLPVADSLLMMGDLFQYLLSGVRACEYSNASTTQLLNPRTRTWNEDLIKALGLPRQVFLDLTEPGTRIGSMLPELAAQTGLSPETPVIAPATHDTGCAVAAVPVLNDGKVWAYLSSGTWSLLGAELDAPCVNAETLEAPFTNEGGVEGTIRFLKNIFGLWLVQECRRTWERSGETLDYATMTAEAEASPAFQSVVPLDDPRLLAPDDMPALLRELSREHGQAVPETRGAVVRCALESLALSYRRTLRKMDAILGRTTERLHIIGGGVQNELLCQMTADACGIEVVAGPVEATALGNIGVQALGAGVFNNLADMRAAVSRSVELKVYHPNDTAAWDRVDC